MQPNYVPFTTKEMIDQAHKLGMRVKPWTVSRATIIVYRDVVGQLLIYSGESPQYRWPVARLGRRWNHYRLS